MTTHTTGRITRAGHRIIATESGLPLFQAFSGAIGPAEADANEERLVTVWHSYNGLVDAVRSALAAARARQAGIAVNFGLLEAEMFAALVAAGVEP